MGSHDADPSVSMPRNVEDDMHYEESRLITFNSWPANAKVDCRKIAKAGFVYTGSGFEVQCVFCKEVISDWEYGDVVTLRHRQLNANCPFVINPRTTSNVPLPGLSSFGPGSSGYCSAHSSESSILPPQRSRPCQQDSVSESADSKQGLQLKSVGSVVAVHNENISRVVSSPYSTLQHDDIVISGHLSDSRDNTTTSVPLDTESQPQLLPQRTQTWQSYEYLKRENERLLTYDSWPLSFIQPEALSRAGFFYLKDADRVQCAFCRGMVGEWEKGDNPWEEHGRHFPQCPFINNLPVGNVPINSTGSALQLHEAGNSSEGPQDTCERYTDETCPVSRPERDRLMVGDSSIPTQLQKTMNLKELGITAHHGPAHLKYATYQSRLKSFRDWPPALRQKPPILAEAGFFYVGLSDHVKCFHCDGGLRNWQEEDEPWIEHARWFSKCNFVLLVKGEEFVEEAIAKIPPIIPSELPESGLSAQVTESGRHWHIPGPRVTSSSDSYSVCQISEDEIQGLMAMPTTTAVLEMGMDPIQVKNVLREKVQQTGIPFSSSDALVAAVLIYQQQHTAAEETGLPPEAAACRENVDLTGCKSGNSSPAFQSTSANLADPLGQSVTHHVEKGDLEVENQKLKEARLCKICMDEEVGVVFVPCGHLVACVSCASALRDCPFCRQEIRGLVRTFLS